MKYKSKKMKNGGKTISIHCMLISFLTPLNLSQRVCRVWMHVFLKESNEQNNRKHGFWCEQPFIPSQLFTNNETYTYNCNGNTTFSCANLHLWHFGSFFNCCLSTALLFFVFLCYARKAKNR